MVPPEQLERPVRLPATAVLHGYRRLVLGSLAIGLRRAFRAV
jgi:hypothetical protein